MGHAHHWPQGALHEYIRQAPRQCLLIVKWTVPSWYTNRHLCEQMWCWPVGLTLGVPSGRKTWAGCPCRRRRRKGLGDVDLEENLRG